MADKQALGARADLFAAHNSKQAHDVVAAVGGGWRGKKKRGRGGGGGQQVSHTLSHAEQARIGSGLCFSHFCYGYKAKQCEAPCTWSGN